MARTPRMAPSTALLLLTVVTACGDGSSKHPPILFGSEGNRLKAYTTVGTSAAQIVIENATLDPTNGRDVNGQICFLPTRGGPRRFVMGEDTGQPNPPPGFGIFELRGDSVGTFSARQVAKLMPTFQPPQGNADPYGCGVLADGRLLTTDIGNTESGPATGQLIVWFPPLEVATPRFCKLDTAIGTAGGIYVDAEDRIYVASARVTSGILRYTGPFPTSDDAAGGCGRVDATGSPLATETRRETFIIADDNASTPNGVVGRPEGTFYVSSVFNGVIAEYDGNGRFLRRILEPPAGEILGPEPYSTGTPLGIAVDRNGVVYYADLGLVIRGANIGPGPRTGSFRRIPFDGASPLAPETFEARLSFPDGVGVLE